MTGKELREYKRRSAEAGCILCRMLGWGATPPELHHPRTGTGAGRRASDEDIIPLCPEHHRGNTGLHGMGRKAFERRYSVTELGLVERHKQEMGTHVEYS